MQTTFENDKRPNRSVEEINSLKVTLGNTVTFNIVFDNQIEGTYTLKIVEKLENSETQLSLNSPIGQSIKDKNIGESSTYKVNGNEFTVNITNIEN